MTPPKTDADLNAAMRALVALIRGYDTHINWPLSDEERIWFVRRVMGDAKVIAESEPFLRGEMAQAVRAYVNDTRTGREHSKAKTE